MPKPASVMSRAAVILSTVLFLLPNICCAEPPDFAGVTGHHRPDKLFVQQLRLENDHVFSTLLPPAQDQFEAAPMGLAAFAQPNKVPAQATTTPTSCWSLSSISVGTGFLHAVVASFSVIIVTELGDKTFFIAAVMSMQHSKIIVFAGAILALVVMTVLSSLLGLAATIIPHSVTHYMATALFAVFGLKMLYDALKMRPEEAEGEYDETEIELRQRHVDLQRTFNSPATGAEKSSLLESGLASYPSTNTTKFDADSRVVVVSNSSSSTQTGAALPWKLRILRRCGQFCSLIFLEALTLTFLAEWGDRSQIATIALAAGGENFWGVNLGACVGHSLCTGLACIGGSLIAKKISPRQVMIVGGILFLAFAVYGVIKGVTNNEL